MSDNWQALETTSLHLPLPSPDAPDQRADIARIVQALIMLDSFAAMVVQTLSVEIAPALNQAVSLGTVRSEILAALGGDANFAATVLGLIAGKAPLSHAHVAAADIYAAVKAVLTPGANVALTANDSAKTLTVIGQGGGIPEITAAYAVVGTGKGRASAVVPAGQQDLVYGVQFTNSDGTSNGTIDLYVWDASAATEVLVSVALPVPAADVAVFGSLEPMFVLDAGDEIRLVRSGGAVTATFYYLRRAAATDYEMAVRTLTTGAVSQLAAVTGGSKRVVSALVGNVAASGDHLLTIQAFDGTTAWDQARAQTVARGTLMQSVADGLGPRLPIGGQWRALASNGASLAMVTVAKTGA